MSTKKSTTSEKKDKNENSTKKIVQSYLPWATSYNKPKPKMDSERTKEKKTEKVKKGKKEEKKKKDEDVKKRKRRDEDDIRSDEDSYGEDSQPEDFIVSEDETFELSDKDEDVEIVETRKSTRIEDQELKYREMYENELERNGQIIQDFKNELEKHRADFESWSKQTKIQYDLIMQKKEDLDKKEKKLKKHYDSLKRKGDKQLKHEEDLPSDWIEKKKKIQENNSTKSDVEMSPKKVQKNIDSFVNKNAGSISILDKKVDKEPLDQEIIEQTSKSDEKKKDEIITK